MRGQIGHMFLFTGFAPVRLLGVDLSASKQSFYSEILFSDGKTNLHKYETLRGYYVKLMLLCISHLPFLKYYLVFTPKKMQK